MATDELMTLRGFVLHAAVALMLMGPLINDPPMVPVRIWALPVAGPVQLGHGPALADEVRTLAETVRAGVRVGPRVTLKDATEAEAWQSAAELPRILAEIEATFVSPCLRLMAGFPPVQSEGVAGEHVVSAQPNVSWKLRSGTTARNAYAH
jgi:hypothetical protein